MKHTNIAVLASGALLLCLLGFVPKTAHAQEFSFEKLDGPYGGGVEEIFQYNDVILALTATHSSYISSDNGVTWRKASQYNGNYDFRTKTVLKDGTIYATTFDDVYFSTDTMATWNQIGFRIRNLGNTHEEPLGVHELDNGSILLAAAIYGRGDSLYISNDGLQTVTNITPPRAFLYIGQGATGNIYIRSGFQGAAIMISSDYGQTWDSTGTAPWPSTGMTNSGDTLFCWYDSEEILFSVNSGATWTQYCTTPPNVLWKYNRISIRSKSVFIASNNVQYGYMKSGRNSEWKEISIPDFYRVKNGLFLCEDNSVLLPCDGYYGIYRTTDNGTTWEHSQNGMAELGNSALHADDDTLYAIHSPLEFGEPDFTPRSIVVSTDGGITWDKPGILMKSVTESVSPTYQFNSIVSSGKYLYCAATFHYRYGDTFLVPSMRIVDKVTGNWADTLYKTKIGDLVYDKRSNSALASIQNGRYTADSYDILSTKGGLYDFSIVDSPDTSKVPYLFTSSDDRVFAMLYTAGWFTHDRPKSDGYTLYEFDGTTNTFKEFAYVEPKYATGVEYGITSQNHVVAGRMRWIIDDEREYWIDVSLDTTKSWRSYGLRAGEAITDILIDKNDVIYVGTSERVLYSTNSGWSWEDSGFEGHVSDLEMTDGGLLYISTPFDGIFRTTPNLNYVVPVEETANHPASIALSSAYPNPVSVGTPVTLSYTMDHTSSLTLRVQDLLGRTVREVHLGQIAPGTHTRSIGTAGLEPGMYFYSLVPGNGKAISGKMVIK